MTVLVVTLGYDEKFQLRAVSRWFGRDLRKVVIVGSFDDDKAKRALSSLEDYLDKLGVQHERVEVNPHDMADIVIKAGRLLASLAGQDVVVNLSGGMRILIVGVLAAVLLREAKVTIEIETEDLAHLATFTSSDLMPVKLTEDHIKVLNAIREGHTSVNSIHSYLGMPLSTTWRKVKDLKDQGLVVEDDSGKLGLTFKAVVEIALHSFS
ncbi:CRISPR-associated CARF protein Csa3 [Acidilobus sp.]|uniref:CRISPR-associated CARF protein Csa3 n=1 Tax=Acidilobus sp. TaxID=1872109 RepID=UPI003D056EAA